MVALETGLVEHAPGFDAQPRQIAGVQPDADQFVPLAAQLLADLDGVTHAVQRVVGVDQEQAVVGHGPGVGPKRLELVVEAHDPAMGVRSAHGNAVQAPGQHVGRRGAAAQVGGAAGGQAAVDPLGPSQPELQHRRAAG